MDNFVSKIVSEVMSPKIESSKPEGKVDTILKTTPNVEPPLTEYQNLRGKPYTVDYLDIKGWNPKIPIPHIIEGVDKIEKYVMAEIKEKNLMPTLSSYKEIMGKVKSYLGGSENENPEVFLGRINQYIELMNKQKTYEKKISNVRKQIEEAIQHGSKK